MFGRRVFTWYLVTRVIKVLPNVVFTRSVQNLKWCFLASSVTPCGITIEEKGKLNSDGRKGAAA